MNLVLFDCQKTRANLLPFTFIRPVADIRVGILTIREKWEKYFSQPSFSLTENYLSEKFAPAKDNAATVFVNGAVLPNEKIVKAIQQLDDTQALYSSNLLIAFRSEKKQLNYENFEAIIKGFSKIEYQENVIAIQNLWDIFQMNGEALLADFKLLTEERKSQPLSESNQLIGPPQNIFIEEGAVVEASVLNTTSGVIYIGKNAEIMENCAVRAPFALCEQAVLKMSAKIYGATTVGPHSKVGGELNNVVIFGYSNKAHDGFLGNAVIGEWCNLGADTNNSNLKNNYGNVEVFNYREGKAVDTGLTFCGLFMGDHSKSGINTMFNTGTVVGVNVNIFGADFPPKFIPSFSWGGGRWLLTFSMEKSFETAARIMHRRNMQLQEADKKIFQTIFEREEKYRKK